MKIYINREYVPGPWGGGAKPLGRMIEMLKAKNHEVDFDLKNQRYDVYVCWDPRPNSRGVWYGTLHDHRFKFGGKIVQRVGDVGTHGKPELTNIVKTSTLYSDHVIFVSDWALDYAGRTHIERATNVSVIPNGALSIFFKNRKALSSVGKRLKVVTHHWSNNEKKGFDVYSKIDNMITNNELDISFTYIGRIPEGLRWKNIKLISPKDVSYLSKNLPTYDVYLTASREEAGANHVLEAMAAGLPILYHIGGGSIPEYCRAYSNYQYKDDETLKNVIAKCAADYKRAHLDILKFNRTTDSAIKEYVKIIEKMQ